MFSRVFDILFSRGKVISALRSIILLLLLCAGVAAQDADVRVNLKDPVGGVVTKAVVTVRTGDAEALACAADDDAFICKVPSGAAVEFVVRAEGFDEYRMRYESSELSCCEYVFVLKIATVRENVLTITRSDSSIENTPESVAVLGRRAIETSAAPTLDDILRQVPGFSIFRRSSSRNANPTTQGVSLRGVGSSGASRSIVLFDGVSLNDPFGGWVQWNRVAPIAVDEVEVLRGGASSLYGGSALSGGIELRPRLANDEFVFSGEAFGGSQRTASASMFAGASWKGWSADLSAGHFQTRGYIPVDEAERGPVDSYAGVRSVNLSSRIGKNLGSYGAMFFRPTYFGESRTNGTPAQINRTHSRQFVLGGAIEKSAAARFDWRTFGGTQVYDQTFSAVNANRTSESLTRIQRSPAQYFGASGVMQAVVLSNSISAGVEGREVRGSSDEIGFASGVATSLVGAGGRERTIGVFAKDYVRVSDRVFVSGGIRYDRWENFRGISVTRSFVSGATSTTVFPDRDESGWSPSGAILFQATQELSLRAAASRSFRSPTLNELYRGFRVGNVVTNANADLRAERATNFEAGAAYRKGVFGVRANVFLTNIDQAIANVTLTTTPSLITRQRQNAGETRTAGVELDVETRIGKLDLNIGYLFADSRVTEFPSNPTLVDKFIPQVPRHQTTFQLRYPHSSWIFSLQGRAAGEQFDDDLNQFRLEPYLQLDAFVSRRLGERLSLFAGVENVFNTRYSTGRTPIRTVSSPTNIRAGVRWK